MDGIEENFDKDFRVRHFEEQLFTGYADFEQLTDEGFEAFAKYHLATCEVRELLGCSSHLLYVCKAR